MPYINKVATGKVVETKLMYRGKKVSEIDFAVDVLGSIVNFAMRNKCGITEALEMHGNFGEEDRERIEKAVCKSIQTLILEVISREESIQVNQNMLKQLLQWKIEL